MTEKIIFSQPYGSVLVDEEVPCVISQWHGLAHTTDFRTLLEFALAYYTTRHRSAKPWGWIGDTRQMGAISADVHEWLTHDLNPRMYAAGLRQMSIVTSDNVFSRLASQQYVQGTRNQKDQYDLFTVHYPTLEAAKKGTRAALISPV